MLDKDAILEELFDGYGNVDVALRQSLSRQSDAIFRERAESSSGAVLVSFWRTPGDTNSSGTPTEWLLRLSDTVIEVHCVCSPELAEQRFRARPRHRGHDDPSRFETLAAQLAALSLRGPLGIGTLRIVNTDRPFSTNALAAELQNLLSR